MIGAFLLAATAAMPATEVMLERREIALRDVAGLVGVGPIDGRTASRVVATVPLGRSSVSLSREALAGLVRRSVPGLRNLAVASGTVTFRLAAEGPTPRAGSCAALSRDVEAGVTLTSADIVAAPCDLDSASAPVRFDPRTAAVRAAAPLVAGTPLGRLALPASATVAPGDKLRLVSSVGPVRIERDVVALQPGRSGGRVFVMNEEGQAMSAPLALADEEPRP